MRKKPKPANATGTVGNALESAVEDACRVGLAQGTIIQYRFIGAFLRGVLPCSMRAGRFRKEDAELAWSKVARKVGASRANVCLMILRKTGDVLATNGPNPFASCRRVKVLPRHVALPSADVIVGMGAGLNDRRFGGNSSRVLRFLAFTGLRKGELAALQWRDIEDEWVLVRKGKGSKSRRVPMCEPARAVLDEIGRDKPSQAVFPHPCIRNALDGACVRAGIPHLRVHDLRHFFATFCIERGVDIPTVSRWMGHADGGALLMRTYGHLRDEHSLSSAAKLTLSAAR